MTNRWQDRSNRIRTTCIHFRGIQHATCDAGVDWRELTGGPHVGIALRMPCMRENNSAAQCAHQHFPSDEEARQIEAETDALLARIDEDAALINAAHRIEGGASQVWVCEMCDRQVGRFVTQSRAELLVHFQMAHKLQAAEWADVTQTHVRHADAHDWFQDDYRLISMGRVLCLRSSRILRLFSRGR